MRCCSLERGLAGASDAPIDEPLVCKAGGTITFAADTPVPVRAAAKAASLLVRPEEAVEAETGAGVALGEWPDGDEVEAGDNGRSRVPACRGTLSAERFALDRAAKAESLDTAFEGAGGAFDDGSDDD